MWSVNFKKRAKLNNALLIEGLPGIGNVAKIAVEFLAEKFKAVPLASFVSKELNHVVFVTEDNLVASPSINMYYAKLPKRDVVLVTGDLQPFDPQSNLALGEAIVKAFKQMNGSAVVTLGGLATRNVSRMPKVYCTGNNKKLVKEFMIEGVSDKLYGVVGPIVGISGVLLGVASSYSIPAVTLLAETHANPLMLGSASAKQLVDVLSKKLGVKVNSEQLAKEISQQKAVKKPKFKQDYDASYIG
ncbi:PAC2 family protein [Candidatus Woesearchaeota archaeon]|nr:PAC2 family protein [Candidatus Woesearchaeota archaeon]